MTLVLAVSAACSIMFSKLKVFGGRSQKNFNTSRFELEQLLFVVRYPAVKCLTIKRFE